MRTLRLLLAGMAPLALLGAIAGGSLAQDEAETTHEAPREAAVFEGTIPYGFEYQEETREPVPEERMTRVFGRGSEGRLEDVSDRRLAGAWRTIDNEDWYGDAMTGVWTTAMRIDNAEGSWLGHVIGYTDPGGTEHNDHFQQGVLEGSGAYEGLTAVVFMENRDSAKRYILHGMVFPGELPEFPEYPEPAE